MQVNPKILKQKFEKSMPKYNENASVQREMAELLVNNLIKNAGQTFAQILELGSGTGLLTKIIADKLSYEHLTCNDIVEKSKFYLDKIVKNYTFIAGNSMKIKPSVHFDLIISNAMFQWFSSLPAALEYYSRMLNKNGVIAFSTFSSGNFKEIRSALGLSLDYLSVDGIKEALKKDFELLELLAYTKTLDFATPLELLAHLKNTGVNSLSAKKMTFAEVKSFCDCIVEKDGKARLTYAPVIVIARKK